MKIKVEELLDQIVGHSKLEDHLVERIKQELQPLHFYHNKQELQTAIKHSLMPEQYKLVNSVLHFISQSSLPSINVDQKLVILRHFQLYVEAYRHIYNTQLLVEVHSFLWLVAEDCGIKLDTFYITKNELRWKEVNKRFHECKNLVKKFNTPLKSSL